MNTCSNECVGRLKSTSYAHTSTKFCGVSSLASAWEGGSGPNVVSSVSRS